MHRFPGCFYSVVEIVPVLTIVTIIVGGNGMQPVGVYPGGRDVAGGQIYRAVFTVGVDARRECPLGCNRSIPAYHDTIGARRIDAAAVVAACGDRTRY